MSLPTMNKLVNQLLHELALAEMDMEDTDAARYKLALAKVVTLAQLAVSPHDGADAPTRENAGRRLAPRSCRRQASARARAVDSVPRSMPAHRPARTPSACGEARRGALVTARKRYLAALEAEFAAATHGAPLPDHDLATLRAEAEAGDECQCLAAINELLRERDEAIAQLAECRRRLARTTKALGDVIDELEFEASQGDGIREEFTDTMEEAREALDEATREGDR